MNPRPRLVSLLFVGFFFFFLIMEGKGGKKMELDGSVDSSYCSFCICMLFQVLKEECFFLFFSFLFLLLRLLPLFNSTLIFLYPFLYIYIYMYI